MEKVINDISNTFTLNNLGNLDLIWWIIIATGVAVFFFTKVSKLVKVVVSIFLILIAAKYFGLIPSSIFTF